MGKKRRSRYQEYLLDPTLEVASEERAEFSPDQSRQLKEHQILDQKLQKAFTELAARKTPEISAEESFRVSLLERLSRESSSSPTGQSRFFSRLNRRELLNRLRENFFYSSRAPLRWAPALVVLLLLPAALLFYQDSIGQKSPGLEEYAVQEAAPTTDSVATREPGKPSSKKPATGKGEDEKSTSGGELAANLPPRREVLKMKSPARKPEPERFSSDQEELRIARDEARGQVPSEPKMAEEPTRKKGGTPVAAEKKKETVASRAAESEKTVAVVQKERKEMRELSPDLTRRELRNEEKRLKRSLKKARTRQEKMAILTRLEKVYQKLGWPNKLKRVKRHLKRLRR